MLHGEPETVVECHTVSWRFRRSGSKADIGVEQKIFSKRMEYSPQRSKVMVEREREKRCFVIR
jgi:hypothetical protein